MSKSIEYFKGQQAVRWARIKEKDPHSYKNPYRGTKSAAEWQAGFDYELATSEQPS